MRIGCVTATRSKSTSCLVFCMLISFVSLAQNDTGASGQYYDSVVYYYQQKIPEYRTSKSDSLAMVENKLISFVYKLIDTVSHPVLDDNKRKAITWLSDIFSTRGFEKTKNLYEYISKYYPEDVRLKGWLIARLDTNRNFRSKEFILQYGRELRNMLEIVSDNKNKIVQKTLESVWDRDQFYRQKLLLANESNDINLQSQLMDSILVQDRKNLKIVEGVLEKYGWPSPSDIGYIASQAIFLVLHHADTTTFFKYYNLIKEAHKKNKIAREDYELYTDRYYARKFGYQLFGTQSYYDSTLKKSIPYPVKKELQSNQEKL